MYLFLLFALLVVTSLCNSCNKGMGDFRQITSAHVTTSTFHLCDSLASVRNCRMIYECIYNARHVISTQITTARFEILFIYFSVHYILCCYIMQCHYSRGDRVSTSVFGMWSCGACAAHMWLLLHSAGLSRSASIVCAKVIFCSVPNLMWWCQYFWYLLV